MTFFVNVCAEKMPCFKIKYRISVLFSCIKKKAPWLGAFYLLGKRIIAIQIFALMPFVEEL